MAFVLGLAPGKATEVPIVVVAEDGVTSLRYFLSIFRAPGRRNSSRQAALEPGISCVQPAAAMQCTSIGIPGCNGSIDILARACIHEDCDRLLSLHLHIIWASKGQTKQAPFPLY